MLLDNFHKVVCPHQITIFNPTKTLIEVCWVSLVGIEFSENAFATKINEKIEIIINNIKIFAIVNNVTNNIQCQIDSGSINKWRKLVERIIHPNTRRSATDVWEIFKSSGYLNLAEMSVDLDNLREQFLSAYTIIACNPNLGCQINWFDKNMPLGVVTNIKLHENCWASGQLAVQNKFVDGKAGKILEDLYLHYYEHSLSVPKTPKWYLTYVQTGAHWSKKIHIDGPKQFKNKNFLIEDITVFEMSVFGSSKSFDESIIIHEHNEKKLIEDFINLMKITKSEIYCSALGFENISSLLEENIKQEWQQVGLERDRAVFVASKNGKIISGVVVDYTQPGLHVFGLMDTMRFYSFDECGYEAFDQLLYKTKQWFINHNLKTFIFIRDDVKITDEMVGGQKLSDAYMTLMLLEDFPDIMELIYKETKK